ncbi:Arm DNA-binding domain-containing protein [Bradyrhizobium cosmicum]|uniref:Arm DNA-binding domain-containing protein n=1 Tax=Bradyrhizobium cosmicum TaxID=1404864 RepID=UPI0028F16529|nr:Arm DNA-binding domain-containing protein [Bradyrhizobium cosmicum]
MPLGSGTPNSSVSRPQHGSRQDIIRVIRVVTITQRGNAVLCAPNDEGRVGRLQHHGNLALRPIGCRQCNAPEQRATQEATAQQHRTTRIRPDLRHAFGLRHQPYPVLPHADDEGVPFPAINVNATKATYVLKYRVFGRQRFVTIGPHGAPWTRERARKEAKRLLGLVANGKDPAEERAKARLQTADPLRQTRINISGTPNKGRSPDQFGNRTLLVGQLETPASRLSFPDHLNRHGILLSGTLPNRRPGDSSDL